MRALLAALLAAVLLPHARAQDPASDRHLVLFEHRSFDLRGLRDAVRDGKGRDRLDAVVSDLDRRVQRDQAAFVDAVRDLGGAVTAQWWIINGAAVTLPADRVRALRDLPNVAAVLPDRIEHPDGFAPLKDATNAQHHATDQANQRTVGGVPLRGGGIGIAILDTGVDADVAGLGRPHAAYYPGGNPANRTGPGLQGSNLVAFSTSGYGIEDHYWHGTHVSGAAAGNAYANVDDAPAPDAVVVGIKISDDVGNAAQSWIISAWQKVAAERARYRIGVANNSYSGAPNTRDPAQQALDNVAYYADVAVVTSAGNSGTNTTLSQRAYNGVAVGSIEKWTKVVSGFSARGPLSGSLATYPDLVAVGGLLTAAALDDETQGRTASGTSAAAPLVAGILALIRQANPSLDARQAMAILLDTTVGGGSRNEYGLGMAHGDRAVVAAMDGKVFSGRVTPGNPLFSQTFTPPAGTRRVTMFSMRSDSTAEPANLDLSIYDASGQQVAIDGNPANNYEQVTFNATGGSYRLQVELVGPGGQSSVDFAIHGAGAGTPAAVPVLTSLAPSAISIYQPAKVVVTGQNLDSVTRVTVGGQDVSTYTVVSPTRLDLQLGELWPIQSHSVVVASTSGSSNPLVLQVVGQHPAHLEGPAAALRGFPASPYEVWGDAGWRYLFLASQSNQPSAIPGLLSLGLGASFNNLFEIATVTADGSGHAQLDLTVPTIMVPGPLYFAVLAYDPANPFQLPFETSNVVLTRYF